MNDAQEYKYHNIRNGLKWIMQGSINKHFFSPYGKEYRYIPKKIDGRNVMDCAKTQETLATLIREGKPFWMARYGHTEMRYINSVLYKRYINKKTSPENADIEFALKQLCNNAGFFPYDEKLGEKYVDQVLNVAENIDVHAIWDLWMEEYMLAIHEKNARIMQWSNFAPYYLRREDGIIPWTHALAGKKVLVINPFIESIKKQYDNKRVDLFSNIFEADMILPEFDLKTYKSVQTSGGAEDSRFNNWFEALRFMIDDIGQIDFDIALIGCGAYGFLIADAIKRMGKGAIQSCGCTQMLFGVLGKRWTDDKKLMSEVINDHWVRPSDTEKSAGYQNVEDGCYW